MATKTPQQHELHTDKTTRKHRGTSPNIQARAQEKEELSDLNNRLAAYIDRVRSLESQNAKLSVEVNQAKDTCSREIGNIKAMYESELGETRRLLDDTSKEKALLKLENNKLNGILVDLRPKLEQEQSSNKRMQGKLRGVERRLNEKEGLLTLNNDERLDLQNRVKDLEEQLDELETKLAKDKEQLEKEIIARIDAENRYQTLKEETQFTAQVHQTEVSEARQSVQTHASNVSVSTDSDYEGLLQAKLQELREEFEEEAEGGKQELEDAYKMKLQQLKDQSEKDRIVISRLLEKQGDINKLADTLKSDNNVLSSKVEHFQKRISEVDGFRVSDKEDFKRQSAERDEKYKVLQGRYDDLEAEYETLLGIKIALDMELAAYNKLLEGEEQRLNLQTSGSTQRYSRKRGHKESMECSKPCVESSASGVISFSDVDISGKFVSITNNGTEDEELSGYFVHRVVDGEDVNNGFKFPSDYVLPPQQSVTIWGESHCAKANPPNEFVLDGDWLAGGKSVATSIVNTDSEVIAKYTLLMSTDGAGKVRRKDKRVESCVVM